MFKLIAIALFGLGIYFGVNYADEINNVVESDEFEQIQEKIFNFIDNKDEIIEKFEEIKD
ncbi:hypothetical protein PE36_13314 [Moritella sp. PE36]|uniref:hypothetical protein n=1 Tax=Moritella sp. PE36 TaxID=58051 RepID=UPI0001568DD7|nr:hypothetical protein [Moritella sp. PE36]EDM65608.1 hypothetical protein PE36_13314 [Moritella sp. PE36]